MIDNKPKNKLEKHYRQMDGRRVNPYLLQEPEAFNKPSKLIKQVVDTPLTTRQKKIYNYFLRELLADENTTLEINTTVADLCRFLGTTNKHIKDDLIKLSKSTIIINDLNNKTTRAQLISSYTMPNEQESTRTLTIRFDIRLTQILKNIYSYAKLDLKVIQKIKNTNALTLYEIFKRRLIKINVGKINLSEEELRKYLNLENKYTDNRLFNQNLKKWIKEISDNSNMEITYQRKKINKINIYYFLISDFIAMPFNTFKSKIMKIKNLDILEFKINNRLICFYSTERNETLLLTDAKKLETIDTKEHLKNFNKSFTLSNENAKEIWEKLYHEFLENNYIFLYKFFIINDMDIKITHLDELQTSEVIDEKLSQYFDHFTTDDD